MGKSKKRKKTDDGDIPNDDRPQTDSSETESLGEPEINKYQPYKVPGYVRTTRKEQIKKNTSFICPIKMSGNPFTDKDRLALSKGLRKHCVSGVINNKALTVS